MYEFDEADRLRAREIVEELQRRMDHIAAIKKSKERRQRDEPVEVERRSGLDRRNRTKPMQNEPEPSD